MKAVQEASLRDTVWVSLAMADVRHLRPFTNDFASDMDRLVAIQRSNNAGEVLNKDDFPESIWGARERGATTCKTLPDLFFGYGFWVVSARCADILNGFDLGAGSLHSVKVFQKDKLAPIGDHGWFCWNFGNKKNRPFAGEMQKYSTLSRRSLARSGPCRRQRHCSFSAGAHWAGHMD